MKLKVLSALLMSASMSAFVIACDEYGQKKRAETVEPAEPATPQERAETKEGVKEETGKGVGEGMPEAKQPEAKQETAETAPGDVKMDLTNRVGELEKEWNALGAKFEQRADLRSEYQTLSRDIESKIQEMKAQIDEIDKGGVTTPEAKKEDLKKSLDDLEKKIDAAEERLG